MTGPPIAPAPGLAGPRTPKNFPGGRPPAGGRSFDVPRMAAGLFMLHVLSAVFFIVLAVRPVFDDPNNLRDVERYVSEGINLKTIREHLNPTGPGSFIWIASWGEFFGGQLRSYRLAVLASWVMLGAAVIGLGRRAGADSRTALYGALLAAVTFPHAALTTGIIMTEGPALLFASTGAILGTMVLTRPFRPSLRYVAAAAAGLSLGLAVFCRQYYLALLPAMSIVILLGFARVGPFQRQALAGGLIIATMLLPPAFLVAVWGNLSSPAMVSGESYNQAWSAEIGLNFQRPLLALFYLAVYLTPLTFPAVFTLSRKEKLLAGAIALGTAVILAATGPGILQWGPIRSAVLASARLPGAERGIVMAIGAAAAFNLAAVLVLAYKTRSRIGANPHAVFAGLFLLFFMAEQIGVGGNLGFYERYVLQAIPFVGTIAFTLLPGLDLPRAALLIAMFVGGQAMLWRYVTG